MTSTTVVKQASTADLTGKVALVTGGGRGIGAAISKRLAAGGAAVALTYVRAVDQARRVAEGIEAAGGRATVIQAGHQNRQDVRELQGGT